MTAFDDNSIFKKGLVVLGPFALLRLTSSNDSLMNGQEGTGRAHLASQTIRIALQGGSAKHNDSRELHCVFIETSNQDFTAM